MAFCVLEKHNQNEHINKKKKWHLNANKLWTLNFIVHAKALFLNVITMTYAKKYILHHKPLHKHKYMYN